MTCCVATLCDDRRAIVLVTDTMVTFGGFVYTESDIGKALPLPDDWWALVAGGLSTCERIVERLRIEMIGQPRSLTSMTAVLERCYGQERLAQAETTHLKPIGWTMEEFKEFGKDRLGEAQFIQLLQQIEVYRFDGGAELVVAGFDEEGLGHLLSVGAFDNPIVNVHNMPGFSAIGSGGIGALWWFAFRDVSYKRPIREVLCFAIEAKYQGELAPGVGLVSELRLLRHGQATITLSDERIDEIIDAVVDNIGPHEMNKKKYVDALNAVPELSGVPPLDLSDVKKSKTKSQLLKAKKLEERPKP